MSSNSTFRQPLSKQIWKENYKWETDNSITDTFKRIAKFIASIEKDKKYWENEYFKILNNFKFVAGGRITSNAGTGLKGTSLINCFVSGFTGKNLDSLDSIYSELSKQAKILKSEGGYGCNFDIIRPRNAYIQGIGVESPGTVTLMNLWNESSSVITSGNKSKKTKKGKNKIRKGAMMGVLSCWHPSIEEFITAKQQPGKLTKFNLSVLITDKFMNAVKKRKPWKLIFPDTTSKEYNKEWDGDIEKWQSKGYKTITWKEYKDANELWNLILTSTYNRAEPGVLFYDRINSLNNLNYIEKINATNPCGEQPLPIGGSCVLSSINLTQYINTEHTDFDYEKLEKDIPIMVRFLDAINDLTAYPLPDQKKEALAKRRIGIGYMGYASALYIMNLKYGSPKALKLTEKLAKFITNNLYQASAKLASEKGSFSLYNQNKYLKSEFIKRTLTEETISLIKRNGLRNSHITTIAPTGNSSIFANNVSGGIEPVISHNYIRTVITQNKPDELVLPQSINWETHTCDQKDSWKWEMEGDEYILKKVFNDVTYKIDQNRGLTREEEVTDYAVLEMGKDFNEKDNYAVTLFDLSVDDHINTMKIFAHYVDSAVSKTVNIPNNYPYEDFKKVYMKAYDSGSIKGLTTYRIGTMTSVVSTKKEKEKTEPTITTNTAPERPTTLPCDLVRITVKGEMWLVFIGLYKGKPYEVFAGKIHDINLPRSIKNGSILKQKSKIYSFEYDGEILIKNIVKTFESDENESISRLISTALRHGAPIEFIVEQLTKSKGTIVDFSKSILRALKKYIIDGEHAGDCPSCNGKLIYIEGCAKCIECTWSKCS